MRIGFDAKRLFFNRTGLGNYSRSIVNLLERYYPEDKHFLFSPKEGNPLGFKLSNDCKIIIPNDFPNKQFPSLWRSANMRKSIIEEKIDIFHGLSNELPFDIRKSGAKSVVTIHDIIFVKLPGVYKPVDRFLYEIKYKSSCFNADRVIAISQQTKNDLIECWNIPEDKIDIVYQGCSSIFYEKPNEEKCKEITIKYSLPKDYIISVGTVEERKNLLLTVKAMVMGKIDMPLVVCGGYTPYVNIIKEYARKENVLDKILFLNNIDFADLPAIYAGAKVSVYASLYEGFGLPILESLNCGIPVITSQGGVFSETGGDAAYYVNPYSVDAMIEALNKVSSDNDLRKGMIAKGYEHAELFRDENVVKNTHDVYQKLYEQ